MVERSLRTGHWRRSTVEEPGSSMESRMHLNCPMMGSDQSLRFMWSLVMGTSRLVYRILAAPKCIGLARQLRQKVLDNSKGKG